MNYLRQLHYFTTLAEQENFARAAEILHLSQPALSRSVQALEHSLNCQLVNRNQRSISLTPHGRIVLEHAQRLISTSRALENAVAQLNDLNSGTIHFGCGPLQADYLVPNVISQFNQRHPKIHLEVSIDSRERLRRRLMADEIEFFIADCHELADDPRMALTLLKPSYGVLFCRPQHPILQQRTITLKDVRQFPFASTPLPKVIEHALVDLNKQIHDGKVLDVQCNCSQMLKRLVQQSDLIGLTTLDVIAQDALHGQFVLFQPDPVAQQKTSPALFRRADRSLSPSATALQELIIEQDTQRIEPQLKFHP